MYFALTDLRLLYKGLNLMHVYSVLRANGKSGFEHVQIIADKLSETFCSVMCTCLWTRNTFLRPPQSISTQQLKVCTLFLNATTLKHVRVIASQWSRYLNVNMYNNRRCHTSCLMVYNIRLLKTFVWIYDFCFHTMISRCNFLYKRVLRNLVEWSHCTVVLLNYQE